MIYKDLSVALLTFIIRLLNGGHCRRRGADVVAVTFYVLCIDMDVALPKSTTTTTLRLPLTLSVFIGPAAIPAQAPATASATSRRMGASAITFAGAGCRAVA
jgi:hypothetical protein